MICTHVRCVQRCTYARAHAEENCHLVHSPETPEDACTKFAVNANSQPVWVKQKRRRPRRSTCRRGSLWLPQHCVALHWFCVRTNWQSLAENMCWLSSVCARTGGALPRTCAHSAQFWHKQGELCSRTGSIRLAKEEQRDACICVCMYIYICMYVYIYR